MASSSSGTSSSPPPLAPASHSNIQRLFQTPILWFDVETIDEHGDLWCAVFAVVFDPMSQKIVESCTMYHAQDLRRSSPAMNHFWLIQNRHSWDTIVETSQRYRDQTLPQKERALQDWFDHVLWKYPRLSIVGDNLPFDINCMNQMRKRLARPPLQHSPHGYLYTLSSSTLRWVIRHLYPYQVQDMNFEFPSDLTAILHSHTRHTPEFDVALKLSHFLRDLSFIQQIVNIPLQ
jgi:hypothetical protein